jgi:hypothetical protein
MGADLAFAETSRQLMRYALDESAGIDEDQRCPMRFDPANDSFVKLRPDIVRHYRTQLLIGNFYGKIEVALVADIDNRAVRPPVGADMSPANQQPGDFFNRFLRGAEPYPLQRSLRQGFEALQGERQVGPSLVAGHRVDLIHDDGFGVPENFPAALRGEQNVEGLRRGDEDVGRSPYHELSLPGRRVAGSDGYSNICQVQPLR